ncbi:MAG TPA: hypothetical protein VK029_11485 [Pseudogracilibacillus sp.]|nr:hypothetical protein [Pseudogracilibacillus sp.]
MKLIEARDVSMERLEQFAKTNEIAIGVLQQACYIVETDGKIIGFFELEQIETDGVYWLKQLYIVREQAMKLPLLLEYILQFARGKNASVIYAHSEQPVTDLLLESLRFSLQVDGLDVFKEKVDRKGHWWSYKYAN